MNSNGNFEPSDSLIRTFDQPTMATHLGRVTLSGRLDLACKSLREAMDYAPNGDTLRRDNHAEVSEQRENVRSMAVMLKAAGYWQAQPAALRRTIALLWEADQYLGG